MASENLIKLIEAASEDENLMAEVQEQLDNPDKAFGMGAQPQMDFFARMKEMARRYGVDVTDEDISEAKDMFNQFNAATDAGALNLNGSSGSEEYSQDVRGLFSSLFGGNNYQNLNQQQVQSLLQNANTGTLTGNNAAAVGGLSSLLGGNTSGGLLSTGGSILKKLLLVYLFMKLLRG